MRSRSHRLLIYRKYFDEQVTQVNIKEVSNITKGIVDDRKQTDVLCLAIFLVCLMISLAFNVYSWVNGNTHTLVADYDGDRMFCGVGQGQDLKYENHTYLYLTNLNVQNNAQLHDHAICVDKCPTAKDDEISCVPTKQVPNCPKNGTLFITVPRLGLCYPSEIGLPKSVSKEQYAKTLKLIMSNQSYVNTVIQYEADFGIQTVFCLFTAIILNLLSLVLLRYMPRTLLNIMLFMSELLFISSICGLFYVGLRKEEKEIYFLGGSVVILLDVLFNMMLYCFWDDFLLGVSIVKIALSFLCRTKRLLYASFFQFCFGLIVLYIWLVGFLNGLSLSIIKWKNETMVADPSLNPNTQFSYSTGFTLLIVYQITMFIWMISLLGANLRFIIYYSTSTYYFSSYKEKLGEAEVFKGV